MLLCGVFYGYYRLGQGEMQLSGWDKVIWIWGGRARFIIQKHEKTELALL